MVSIFIKKVQCLSLSKLCRNSLVVSRSASTTVTAVDYDEQTSTSSSNEETEHRRHVPRVRRIQELASAKRTRHHVDTIIRDRGIALLRNPQTNKV